MIVIKRANYFRGRGRLRPFGWWYECDGPDGTHFTNESIGSLRSLLRRRYGREIVIKEEWK